MLIIYNNIKATTSRHPLTGNIIGYRVEYEYCCPDPDPDPVLVEDDDEQDRERRKQWGRRRKETLVKDKAYTSQLNIKN